MGVFLSRQRDGSNHKCGNGDGLELHICKSFISAKETTGITISLLKYHNTHRINTDLTDSKISVSKAGERAICECGAYNSKTDEREMV